MSRDLFLSKGGKWIGVVCQVSHVLGSLSFSYNVSFPDSFRFLKAIRHCRICQLRSSKRFWDCGKHRKLYKNISSYFICQVPLYIYPRRFSKSSSYPLAFFRLSSLALRCRRFFVDLT